MVQRRVEDVSVGLYLDGRIIIFILNKLEPKLKSVLCGNAVQILKIMHHHQKC